MSSVLNQVLAGDTLEVVVVNDSGRPLNNETWQLDPRVVVLSTQRRERSFARNAGAAMARGKYLHFLDDDDWLLPNAMHSFWQLSQSTRARWLYGGARLDDREGRSLTLHLERSGNCFAQAVAGEWIPLQASLIEAGLFFSAGGFNPLATPGEDRDLCPRAALRSDFAFTNDTVVVIECSHQNSTTNLSLALENSRREREKILDEATAFDRMIESADSAYWRGRVPRIYAASVIRNLRGGRMGVSASRTAYCGMSLLKGLRSWSRRDFVRGLTRPHTSRIVAATE